MEIANSIGRFILIKDDQLLGFDQRAPWMLVEIDMEEGLIEEIKVIW